MDNRYFEKPILNTPYTYASRHWEVDDQGQPTQKIPERPNGLLSNLPKYTRLNQFFRPRVKSDFNKMINQTLRQKD